MRYFFFNILLLFPDIHFKQRQKKTMPARIYIEASNAKYNTTKHVHRTGCCFFFRLCCFARTVSAFIIPYFYCRLCFQFVCSVVINEMAKMCCKCKQHKAPTTQKVENVSATNIQTKRNIKIVEIPKSCDDKWNEFNSLKKNSTKSIMHSTVLFTSSLFHCFSTIIFFMCIFAR